ncbi:MAG: efflux RND transporter periplasmic adaptor subunit [Pseudomonadaceae bacterium]|nr:efflux RND transporter periplasmic adaptor subunit [Pseudomonadaceae bacterium]
MKRWAKIALPILILGLSVVGAIAMFAARPEPQFNAPEPPSLLVQVETISAQPITYEVRSQGTVSPRTQTTMVAEASGQIVEVSPSFVSGGFFSKGDVLIRIDPRNYASAVKRASAEVAKAATQLQTETALAGYAAEDFERLRRLNPDQGPATELALRKPQLRQAMAELQSAEAALEKAQGDLDRTVIRAPYDGLVREKLADVGQYVNSGSQLGVTFAVDIAEVRLPVTQHDLQYLDIGKLRLNSPIEVELTAELGDTNFNWRGEVRRSEGVFDTTNRVLYLVAQIEDPYDLDGDGQAPLLMGTFVSARIVGRYAGELMLVPRHSLQRGNTLWMLDEEQRIYPREVEVVRRDKDFVYIQSGVEGGELYVVTPIDQPLPGMKVRLES